MLGRRRVTGSLRRVAVSALAAAAVAVVIPAQPAQAAFSAANGVRLNGFESRLVALINQARTSRGIPAFVVTPGTTDLARKWAYVQASTNTMKHNPNLVADSERHGSPNWTQLAENVGKGYSADSLFNAYMNSPGHRANILNRALRYLGMGYVERPDGWGYNTQVFTNQYSTTYGANREPAYGTKLDRRLLTATTSIGSFEAADPRAITAVSGAGISVTAPVVDPAGTLDGSLRFGVANKAAGTGGGAQVRLRDALDFTNVRAITVRLTARTATQRPLTVEMYMRSILGTNVRVGTVSVPHGPDRVVTFELPLAARGFRNELSFFVSRASLAALDPGSYAGRSGTVYIRQVTAEV